MTFPKLRTIPDDIDFAFEAKRAAMGPHIVQRWGWDEEFQRDLHLQRYQEKPFFEIRKAEHRLGTVSFQVFPDHVRLGEFYLFPDFQKKGIGSRVLEHCLLLADKLVLPVRLEYLHWNPVGSLYRHHGFVEIGQSDIHCFMERSLRERTP
ncbi:acetyltransferase [Labrenzia sp. OB1]|nr:acetyltransferase [Labrenzia sp. OB1]